MRADQPSAAQPARTAVYLFGRIRVERDGRTLHDLGGADSRELLAYLLLHRDRPHRREAVAERLWGGGAAEDPRKRLRQALWRLNSVLDGTSPVLELCGDEWIQLKADGALWLDVAALESGWREVGAFDQRELPESAWSVARAALDLYRGDLLEGSDQEWCVLERERLRDIFLAMGDAVMNRYLASSEIAEGIRLGFEILRHDPARETTHCSLMRLHALEGNRNTALRQYERCAAALRRELNVEPRERTRELFEQIRDDRLAPAPFVQNGSSDDLAPLLARLAELRQLLTDARREVHREIEEIEKVVEGRRGAAGETGGRTRVR